MATLVGFSVPTQISKNIDHTYVHSDDNYIWECFGQNAGGNPVCSGIGDSSFADCLSHPRYLPFGGKVVIPGITKYAGITYGTIGLCHQAANRILYPAGVIVAHAKGYQWSSFAYGTYGSESVPWPQLQQCGKSHVTMGTTTGASASQGGPSVAQKNDQSAQLAAKIRDIYADMSSAITHDPDFTFARKELRALFDVRLGEEYDQRKFDIVANLQFRLRMHKRELAAQLQSQQLTPEQFTIELRNALTKTATQCENVLGAGDFVKLFGIEAKDAADILNPPS
jgi:hypothetical protein